MLLVFTLFRSSKINYYNLHQVMDNLTKTQNLDREFDKVCFLIITFHRFYAIEVFTNDTGGGSKRPIWERDL